MHPSITNNGTHRPNKLLQLENENKFIHGFKDRKTARFREIFLMIPLIVATREHLQDAKCIKRNVLLH